VTDLDLVAMSDWTMSTPTERNVLESAESDSWTPAHRRGIAPARNRSSVESRSSVAI